MSTFLSRLLFPSRSGAPGTPSNGEVWYDTALNKFRAQQNGAAVDMITAVGAGSVTKGTATVNFGAFPGASDASIAVTGQAGIVAGSAVWCWLAPIATADHTADEHLVESLAPFAGTIVAGTGFTIFARNTSEIFEPLVFPLAGFRNLAATVNFPSGNTPTFGGTGTRIYGQWTVGWAWV